MIEAAVDRDAKREEAVGALVLTARATVDAFRASYERGAGVDPELHRALQRLHLACELVEHYS